MYNFAAGVTFLSFAVITMGSVYCFIKLMIAMQMFSGFLCKDCIDSPEAYKDIFENILETGAGDEHCVARGLMGSIVGPYSYERGDCPLNKNQKPDSIRYLND